MKPGACFFAATLAVAAQPLAAQVNPFGPPEQSTSSSVVGRGAEVRANVRIALGSRDQLRREARPLLLELQASPSLRLGGTGPIDRPVSMPGNGLRLSFAPGHSTRLSMAGIPLVSRYANSSIAAAEGAEGQGRGVSPLAIAGGVLLVGIGVAYLALEDAIDCTESGNYVCE